MCDFKRNIHVFAKFVRLIGVLWIRQFIGLQLEVGGYRVRSAKTRHKKFLFIFSASSFCIRDYMQILLRGTVVQTNRKTAPGTIAPGLFSG